MNKKTTLILGDILAIAIVTIIGFISHDEFDFPNISRMGTTFFPLLLSWFIAATWLDLFDERIVSNPQLFWRILVAMLLAAPLAGILRAALLHTVAQPLFVFILGGTAALVLLAWRGIFFLIAGRIEIKM
jgi:hypothetical protein